MITDLWTLALVLFAGHFICDYGLQSQYMSQVKNPFDPENKDKPSRLILLGHASIHGAFVAVVTGYPIFGFIETFLHWVADLAKCKGSISFKEDQYYHLFCKLCYFLWIAFSAYLTHTYG